MPRFPAGTLCLAVAAVVFGCCCIVYGLMENLLGSESAGATYWVMGAIFGIPGLYACVVLFKALGADDPGERVRILKTLVS